MSAIRKVYELAEDTVREHSSLYEALKDVDIDRTEKLIALGEAALAKEIAAEHSGTCGDDDFEIACLAEFKANDIYDTALAALKETP